MVLSKKMKKCIEEAVERSLRNIKAIELKIERKVDAILTILEKHFGEVDESIVERIRIVRNNFVLDDLVVYALNCETITEFSDVLQRYIDEVHVELIDEYIYKRKS